MLLAAMPHTVQDRQQPHTEVCVIVHVFYLHTRATKEAREPVMLPQGHVEVRMV